MHNPDIAHAAAIGQLLGMIANVPVTPADGVSSFSDRNVSVLPRSF